MRQLLFTFTLVIAMATPTRTSELASLSHASEWVNSPPLTADGLRGKVVVVQFWTYSCVNWIRTAPYVRAWAEKYRDAGLVVIGVHSPEFGFERRLDNVRWSTKSFGVDYPVAVDNDFAIWRGFGNQYWPALYILDGKGQVRYRHFGEGEYEQTERAIQELLAETGARGVGKELASVTPQGAEAAADWARLKTPETYLGAARGDHRVAPGARLHLNEWTLDGDWTVTKEAAVLNRPNGRIAFRFHARDLNLVMTPGAGGKPVRFRVFIDGEPAGAAHGGDVDEQGYGTVAEPRMYQLIRQPGAVGDRRFEIQFLDQGVEAYVFTFG